MKKQHSICKFITDLLPGVFSGSCPLSLLLLIAPCSFLAASNVYVVNEGSNNVSVIDTDTNIVFATVAVGGFPIGAGANLTVTPDGMVVYVVNDDSSQGSGTVSVIDTTTLMVIYTITVGVNPDYIAVSPDGMVAYVTNQGGGDVSVIDTDTDTVFATITIGNNSNPFGIACNPVLPRVYVANEINNVSVIDTGSNTILATISVGLTPQQVAVNPLGTRAYVTNLGSQNVSVIDTGSNTIFATIPVGNQPEGIAVAPNGLTLYVVNSGNDTVSVIDTGTNMVTATITVGTNPYAIAVTPDSLTAYVSNQGVGTDSNVSVIDTVTQTIIATVPVGISPFGVAIGPSTSVPPPQNFNVLIKRNDVIWEYELFNILKWTPSVLPVASYIVFANGKQIATVTAVPNLSNYKFKVNNVPKGQTIYSVIAVDSSGNQSLPISITVTNK